MSTAIFAAWARMYSRNLAPHLVSLAADFPVVAVLGPRQSGKTTLCRMAFADKPYVNLEEPDTRQFATTDPRGFLGEFATGAILDEVQNCPQLLSYLQSWVDRDQTAGRFVLTGSQQHGLHRDVAQSLAGRVGIAQLLPLAHDELGQFPHPPSELWATVWQGGYPRIADRHIAPDRWLASYVATYLQRDVRQLLNVVDLQAFTSFLRLCAGRTAQELNLSDLGADAGASHNTARAWLSVLEASFVCFRLPAWHTNIRKQVIKAPKLHFFDSGLACYLLGIHSAEQLQHHPLRGPLFETWVVSEVAKSRLNQGKGMDLFHYREATGLELDLLVDDGASLTAVEVKSGATVASDWFRHLAGFAKATEGNHLGNRLRARVVFGGEFGQTRSAVEVVAWRQVAAVAW